MQRTEALKSRWLPEWSRRSDLVRLSASFFKALDVIDLMPKTRSDMGQPGNLSEKGLNESVRAFAAEKVIPDLRRAMWTAEKTANGIKNDLSKLAIPRQHDKTDVAGAMLRAEIRTMLRGMDQGERLGLIMEDPAFLAAAFEGPAALSGLTEDLRNETERRLIEQNHAPAMEAMNSAREAVDLTQAAIEMAVGAVKAAGAFGNDHHFSSWMQTASAEVEREISAEKATAPASKTDGKTYTLPTFEFRNGELVQNGMHVINLEAAA
ncbi:MULTISPECIES: hypothetical protein [unclassified Mesorhizobium]|uniref:hypothetical protein n=1 Tax=unclassified Mesorhizobium TaxID=325217 RepID=UPI000FCB4318|nr:MULTISPECIES: hypothetical protein [unclassified Mesorhizobium]RVD54540.1 hypothetical protein EN783_30385 [Mesorhizobium sp. M2D.F.Ca.ET.140.01.1.1]TGP69393.1 hypothetical protein EN867_30965 [Mesorhizobium sp. M2D.F.Ca.ET.224.01.1.1]TGP86613.1 hypothetical protein EN865_30960 [bacterium M00.F.Ca.ET.222.01.1.1]